MLLLALTGYGTATDYERSVKAGFDHHLVKPVDPSSSIVCSAIGGPKQP
jgi:CheY-like chemotaxis protein